MYGKLFASMYDGTLGTRGPWQALITFQQLIILADQDGVIDMTPEAIARRTTIPLEIITKGLAMLEQPDPDSRSPDEEGRRIVRLSDTRLWGWRITNYAKYRAIRTAEERRDYMRKYQRTRRAKLAAGDGRVNSVNRRKQSQPIAEVEAEAENPKPTVGLSPDDVGDAQGATAKKRQQARQIARRAIEYLNERAGTRFQPVEATLKLPAARVLYDGATEADLRAVVDAKAAEAERGEFDRKYLRPATLFNAEKFAGYVGQVHARPPSTSKRDEQATVYSVNESGEQRHITDWPAGEPADVARAVWAKYRGAPWLTSCRSVMVRANGAQSVFSRRELEATAQ